MRTPSTALIVIAGLLLGVGAIAVLPRATLFSSPELHEHAA